MNDFQFLFSLIVYLSHTIGVKGEQTTDETLSTGPGPCTGTNSCVQLGDLVGSPDDGLREIDDLPLAPHTAAGFDPYEPCPTALFTSDTDLRLVENQVTWQILQAHHCGFGCY